MVVAAQHNKRSMAINSCWKIPFLEGKTSPVKVWMRTGTPAYFAATIVSKPAFGVMECTICGCSFLNKRYNFHSATKSFSGLMLRCMPTETVRTPSRWATRSRCISAPDTATTSYSFAKNANCPLSKISKDMATVVVRMIFGLTDAFIKCDVFINHYLNVKL